MFLIAEQNQTSDYRLCAEGMFLSDRFLQFLADQAQLALPATEGLAAWIRLTDATGACCYINLVMPQPQAIERRVRDALALVLPVDGRQPKVMAIADLRRERPLASLRSAMENCQIGGILCLPVCLDVPQITACLWIAMPKAMDWGPAQIAHFSQLALVLGASLDREADLLLHERDQQITSQMTTLANSVAEIFDSPGLPLRVRYQAVLDLCCRAFDMEEGHIAVLRRGTPEIQFRNSKATEAVLPPSRDIARSFSAMLIRDPVPLAISNVEGSALAGRVGLTEARVRRYLGCPILFDGRVQGTIELTSATASTAPFSQQERAMMRMLATMIAGPLMLH